MTLDKEELSITPPSAERVAACAIAMAAFAYRGLNRESTGKAAAEQLRRDILNWIEQVGASEELGPRANRIAFNTCG